MWGGGSLNLFVFLGELIGKHHEHGGINLEESKVLKRRTP